MTFPGITAIVRAEVVLTRGILPGVHVVRIGPQDGLDLEPGELVVEDGIGGVLNLPDCLVLSHSMRQVELRGGWVWELEVLDHRWRWPQGSVGGEWNRRLPDGSVDPLYQKTPAELATMCLDGMGESGYDVSHMPATVYPYCNWNDNPSADLSLKALCDAVACEICGGEFEAVTIWPAGQGPDLPSGGVPMHQETVMVRPAPGEIIVAGGRKRYATQLKLRAFGIDTDETVALLDNLSYRPASGWGVELPGVFAGLSATPQQFAKLSVWVIYQVTGQSDGSLAVPTSAVTVESVLQYELLDVQIARDDFGDGSQFALPAVVSGAWYNYGDVPTDEAANTLYLGTFDLDLPRQRVTFPLPIFSMGSDQTPQEPTLKLLTSYYVRDAETGQFESLEVTQSGPGVGAALVIIRPELFDSYDQGTSHSFGTSEANQYLTLFQAKYADNELQDQLYAGIPTAELSGIVAQITVMGSAIGDEGFTARICRLEELAPLAPSQIERKRKEIVRMIQEERGL